MHKGCLLLALVSMLCTGSCEQKATAAINVYEMSPDGYEVFLYTEKGDLELEEEYMDAILELRVSNPDKLSELTLRKMDEEKQSSSPTSVSHYPTLVIEKDGQTIATMSGDKTKEDIYSLLRKTLSYN
ncbi:thioredoxin domain-containing protein [Pontibacillus salicampi]|uniref:Thioredoxin domain-containing protein n=1 Tax=Pontibacillus salicampi TaxID=1449801 RepID=A0ABV6LNM3_9BACI